MKISKKNSILFLYVLSIIPPLIITQVGMLKTVLNIVQIVGFLYSFILFLKKQCRSDIIFLFIIFDMAVFTSTFIGNGRYFYCLIEIFNNLSLPILLISGGVEDKRFFYVIRKYFKCLCYINFIYLLMGIFVLGKSPDDSLFIVDSNGITVYMVIAFMLEVMYIDMYDEGKRKEVKKLCIVISITEILVWSATGMLTWFGFVILFWWSQSGKKRIIPFFKINILTTICSICILAMGVSSIFSGFLSFLGKEATLTGRTNIWANAVVKINTSVQSKVIGYGYGEHALYNYVAHNEILELLINGGMILLCTLVIIYIYTGRREKRLSQIQRKSKTISIEKSAICALGIAMMTEIIPWTLIFFIFSMFDYSIKNAKLFESERGMK